MPGEVGLHERVQVAVHYGLDLGSLVVRAQVLDQLVRHENMGPYLVAPADVALRIVMAFHLRALLFKAALGYKN